MDFGSSSTTPAGAFSQRAASSTSHRPRHQQQEEKDGRDAQDDVEMVDEATRARDERLANVRKRIAAYEQCVDAMGVVTASLEELSTKLETMKTSTQQLNAFTSGWLSVWKRTD